MAVSILIEFPISTVQYENDYMLGIEMDYSATLEARLRDDDAFVESGSTEACLIFEGMLNGDTVVQTDGRDGIFDPLISSKLKFNIVSHNFPSWLMEECDYYTDVRCALAFKNDKGQWEEQWRGYLWGNTLNSRVVEDYIVTPVFALDEIGMTKYLKVYNTIGQYGKSRKLWNYFAYYKSLNDSYFGHIYQFMELAYSSDSILWDSPYCLHDANDEELVDFLSILNFDSYGYVYQDEENDKLTWHDLFFDVCQYLGVTFMVGSHGSTANDSYLIETPEAKTRNENYTRIRHNNESVTATTATSGGSWTTIVPNEKVNADFNITLEPTKYKGVKVKSEVKRYEAHDYLDDENLDFYDKDSYVLHRWGIVGDGPTIATYCVDNPRYHKLYYMKPKTKEEQFMTVKTENITQSNNPNAMYLINLGYIQADLNAQNYDYPAAKNNLGYLLTKMGSAVVKLGEFDMREDTEDNSLDNYLILMNHKWCNGGWADDSIAAIDHTSTYALTGNDFESVNLKPFGNHEIRHNNEEHYLMVDYDLMCLNENLGELDRLTSTSPYHVQDMRGSEALAMPSTTTDYDYTDEGNAYGSEIGSYYNGQDIQGYPPIIRWEAEHGQYELTERGQWAISGTTGLTYGYNMQHWPEGYDKCVYAISASTDSFGYKYNPYYNQLKPKSGGGKKDMLINMYQYGGPNAPIDGVLKMKILSPSICFDWKNNKIGYLNNIFFLLNNFKFKFTDLAEILGKPTEYEEMDVYDTLSKTKVLDEINYNLSTPQYDGLFYNCFQYNADNGKLIKNARNFYRYGNQMIGSSMEYWGVEAMANYVAPAPMKVDLSMRFDGLTDRNLLWNNHLLIDDMTETPYMYEVTEKTIYINRNIIKYKADRVYDDPWRDMTKQPNQQSHETVPVNNNEYEQ